jgi:AcrR family transcriptional regulator
VPSRVIPVRERARPLSAEDRRAALVAATLPLLIEHGRQVTTRQIAQASQVAEGTIFRVFPDKDALIQATLLAAVDPALMLAGLAAIDPDLALRPRLLAITEVIQRRLITIISLVLKVGLPGHARRNAADAQLYRAVTRLLEPDQQRLRLPLDEVARMLRLLTFSGSHPMITDGALLSPEQIVDLLLDGVLSPTPPATGKDRA